MAKYLDNNGLLYLVTKLKSMFVAQVSGKGLSTNDYTTAEKEKLAGIASGATAVTVNNTLTSTSTTQALSAAQGKVLNDKISQITGDLEDLGGGDMMKATYDVNGNGVVDNAEALDGHPASYFAAADDLPEVMTGASITAPGKSGLVPAPEAGGNERFLNSAGNWAVPYIHPKYTSRTSGLYKIIVDTTGHVSGAAAVVKSDITALGIPAQDTTYSNATGSTAGLMSAADKSKLDAFGSASSYALKADISGVYKYKGSVSAYSNLPSSGNTAGDVYNVEADGMNYAWTGSAWDALGAAFEIDSITNGEIDDILAS